MINQPIVQGEDNDYYLRHNYRGEYSVAGSVFLDYQNNNDFSDDFSIVYGHRMSGHLMFGDIKLFADTNYFKKHAHGKLKVKDRSFNLSVVGFMTIDAGSDLYRLREFQDGKNTEIVERLKSLSINWRDGYNGEKLLLLSTCNENAKKYRDVLLVAILE